VKTGFKARRNISTREISLESVQGVVAGGNPPSAGASAVKKPGHFEVKKF